MRYFWLIVIAVSVVPVAAASFLLNPLVFMLLGPEAWRTKVGRLHPYRWWLGVAFFALVLATTVYGTKYA